METELTELNALVNRLASLVLKLEDVVAWEGKSPPATPTPADARTTPARREGKKKKERKKKKEKRVLS